MTALAIAGAGTLAFAAPASAVDGDITVTTSNPALPVGGTDVPVAVSFKESAVAKLPAASAVCIRVPGGKVKFDTAAVPGVSDDNAGLTTGAATFQDSNETIKVPITTPSTGSAATITLTGVKVDVAADTPTGQLNAEAGDCVAAALDASFPFGFVTDVTREAGNDRYATAQQIAERAFDCGPVDDVVIARGDNFPDALAASYLAGVIGAPILLVAPNSVPNETLAALKNLGATGVLVIGGEAAISAEVFNFLDNRSAYNCGGVQLAQNLNADRIFGVDRYATARNVLLHAGTVGTAGTANPDPLVNAVNCDADLRTAIVASGENFPDALAAGPLAFAGSDVCGDGAPIPLLLTRAGSLPEITATGLNAHNVQQVIVMGGTSAISASVATAILDLPTVTNVTRVAGADRQGTAVELTEKILQFDAGGWVTTNRAFFISRPDAFPDALAAAPLAGSVHGPLFLSASTSSLGTTAGNGIKSYPGTEFFHRAVLLGGEAALTNAVKTETEAAIAAQAN